MRILASPAFANEKVNPYNALLYRSIETLFSNSGEQKNSNTASTNQTKKVTEYSHSKALLHKYDILHFHWPDGYINQPNFMKSIQRACLFVLVLLTSKAKGTKIVWTVHNVAPHDAYHAKFSQRFMNWFVKQCDGFIFLSEESQKTFLNYFKPLSTTHCSVIPHGHYRQSYSAAIDKNMAKAELGLPQQKKVLLFFGMIKPYKNIDSLIQIFTESQLEEYILVIAGKPDSPQLEEQLRAKKLNNPSIHLFLEFIPDNQLHLYLSTADIVVLPYRSILNSGALLLALSFSKPVIAPHMGAFIALQKELGAAWVYSYEGDLQPNTLCNILGELEIMERPSLCPLEKYDWNKLAASTLNFYQQLFTHTPTSNSPVIL